MGSIVSSIFGKAPKVSKEPEKAVKEEKKVTAAQRDALLSTAGGINGEELSPDQVNQRPTLLGN